MTFSDNVLWENNKSELSSHDNENRIAAMQILKRLMRWVGRARKFNGIKMLGESAPSPVQPIAFTATSANISSTDCLVIGFWNVHDNVKIGPHIAQLAFTLQKDENGRRKGVLLGLSEIGKLNLSKILADIKILTGDNSWGLHISLSERFACFSTVPIKSDLSEAARGWPVIISLNDPSSKTPKRCAVWFVHLRAPMMTFTPENVSAADARILHDDIIKLEAQQGLDASLAIGDFNADPYSSSMLGPDHLNAVMCRKIASKGSRVFDKGKPYVRVRPYFYNPMWNSLGDQSTSNQPGSFYMGSDPGNSNAWHLIDQVLLRPSLIQRIVSDSARVLISVGNFPLLNEADKIDTSISDHLPVVISLNN